MENSSSGIGMKLIIGFAASCLMLGILSQFKNVIPLDKMAATDFVLVIAVVTLYMGFVVLRKNKTERQYVLLSLMRFWYGLMGHIIVMGTLLYCCQYLNNTSNFITNSILKTFKEAEFSLKHFTVVFLSGISLGIFSVGFSYLIDMTLEKENTHKD